jgi:single-stranded-DNA-specific exonuclease
MSSPRFTVREAPPRTCFELEAAGVHPLLARLLAGRGVRRADELDDDLRHLLPPSTLAGAAEAGAWLADTIERGERLCVVADYDCDGATACAVALRGLVMLGASPAQLAYVVPDRAVHGYGLSPSVVELVRQRFGGRGAQRLVTVDNGVSSFEGVAHANAAGVRVLVTDHHLPALDEAGAARLPAADVIVNPNQPGCGFASKALAGVGAMFYVLLAARAERRARGAFDGATQPRLDALLDLVALGTVADVVRLDANNRRLVAQGLKRIRAGRVQPGLAALFAVAGRDAAVAGTFDLGFAIGPRVNAAGRLSDMTIGIECLLTDDAGHAAELARQLDAINRERREVEAGMREAVQAVVEAQVEAQVQAQVEAQRQRQGPAIAPAAPPAGSAAPAIVLFDAGFHEGVVGIVAGRVKDRLHRPTFAFARGREGDAAGQPLLKGSGRSIAGFHLRDALDLVAKRHPGLLHRFGGHAMAAGCTLAEAALPTFTQALQRVAGEWLDAAALARQVATDGPLPAEHWTLATTTVLDAQVWGAGFPPPLFCDEAEVLHQRLVGQGHLKLRLRVAGREREAIWFGHADPLPPRVRVAYRLGADAWQGEARLQMLVEAAAPA